MEQVKPKYEREPENAPGSFYVAKDQCIICMLPVESAPLLFGFYDNSIRTGSHAGSHCYFQKQPSDPEEFKLAIEAVNSACCGALRYCGNDKTVIDQILAGSNSDSVDI